MVGNDYKLIHTLNKQKRLEITGRGEKDHSSRGRERATISGEEEEEEQERKRRKGGEEMNEIKD